MYAYFAADPVFAAGVSAEYKCTSNCSLCISFDKKTVCSEKYPDDSEEYEKAKKLSRFVNEGLIIPSSDIKQGFSLNAFANKFFNCEFMIKKAEQIKQAAENMCVRKTVKRETFVPRQPASVEREVAQDGRGTVREKEPRKSGVSIRELKKIKPQQRQKKVDGNVSDLTPPPSGESMDDLIKQMDE